jgi:hypothetical protein
MSAEDAVLAMQAGDVPPRLHVEGDVHLYDQVWVAPHKYEKLAPPRALPAEELVVAGDIVMHDASLLTQWPRILRCHELHVWKLPFDFPLDAEVEIAAPEESGGWSSNQLVLQECPHLTRFPTLRCAFLREARVDDCPALEALPAGLRTKHLSIRRCPRLVSLSVDLQVTRMDIMDCPQLSRLPDDCVVTEALDLSGCANLTRLPDTVEAQRLNIANCRRLTALPARLRSLYIDMSGCTGIERWDDPEVTALRQLSARGCGRLESLPPNLRQIDELDVSGCARLTCLPDELRITRWVDVGGSGIRELPASAQGTQVRWNGVHVTGQIAFHPETVSARQALLEENAELRRVMLERIGPERFLAEARPRELDADTDAGGPRRLLRVEIPNDEPLVALQVRDPSTGRQYLLRVPPDTDTCRQAAAWIAGFDNPNDYQPVLET